jgi:hypothetical protein
MKKYTPSLRRFPLLINKKTSRGRARFLLFHERGAFKEKACLSMSKILYTILMKKQVDKFSKNMQQNALFVVLYMKEVKIDKGTKIRYI